MTRPCTANPAPFDRLIDLHTPSRALSRDERTAARAAIAICEPCPLREACWNANRDEPWMESMRLVAAYPPEQPPKSRRVNACATCGRGHFGTRDLCRVCWRKAHAMAPDDPRHGQVRGYKAHKTRKEDPCGPCAEAWSKYLRDRREKRAAAEAAAARVREWVA